MVKLTTEKDKILAGVTLAVGASIAVCYDILQNIIQSIAPNTEIMVKLEAGGISIGLGVFVVIVLINFVNKKII